MSKSKQVMGPLLQQPVWLSINPYEVSVCVYLSVHNLYNNYLLTYLLTPWSRVLLEKLTGLQLVKKFPALYGT